MGIEDELKGHAVERDTMLSIGVFDGVHLGHRHLLGHLRERAQSLSLLPGVITFSQHPRQMLQPQRKVSWLTPLEQRLELLRGLGMEVVVTLTFTPPVAALSARDFLSLLQQHLRMKGIVIGPDFALGRGREGNAPRLREFAQEMGFALESVGPIRINGEVVSSTAIRQALARGEVAKVNRFLGRPFTLMGKVVHGEERGRVLGFPTANIAVPPQQALPAYGVYATRALVRQGAYPSVTNIGVRPTFGSGPKTIEVFLLDFQDNLYGENMTLALVERLREERRFTDPAQLAAQIEQDIARARSMLSAVENGSRI